MALTGHTPHNLSNVPYSTNFLSVLCSISIQTLVIDKITSVPTGYRVLCVVFGGKGSEV